ncbi:Asp-tRNA(Asn)/Glu-tRNA(Gln) amidotransferase subunit GatC [Patescibacteria group bacterium]|nr:Asp-tRNA(Asn)/Glu-tRNA(Gln) amidotransferase subunit GatC [Patescibacteria group bacterium]
MKIDIKHIAKLANLPVSNDEERKFEKQLTSILDYVEQLNSVDTKDIDPTSQVTNLENITREDKLDSSLDQEKALLNTKSKHNGFFKVGKILDNE